MNDAKHLLQDYGIRTKSTFDLPYLAAIAGCNPGSLAMMSENYLDIKLNKKSKTHSGWEDDHLSVRQTDYAAKDAYVAIKLFKYFQRKLLKPSIMTEDYEHVQYVINEYCYPFLDIIYNGAQGVPHVFIQRQMSTVKLSVLAR